jgi:hypothetical protein
LPVFWQVAVAAEAVLPASSANASAMARPWIFNALLPMVDPTVDSRDLTLSYRRMG